MGQWFRRSVAVILLVLAGGAAWVVGSDRRAQEEVDGSLASAIAVPATDLAELQGKGTVEAGTLKLRLQNTTLWFLTDLTIAVETRDADPALSLSVTQNFRGSPWAPGAWNEREIVLPAEWADLKVQYSVIAAEGFQ